MVKKPKALIITGKGINCDWETLRAFEMAGADAKRVHILDLVSKREKLGKYHIMAIPGGFSYGDDLGAGIALANKMRIGLKDALLSFVRQGKLIIGICNGFQVLVRLGLLPALNGKYLVQNVTLTNNASGRFEDRWVNLGVNDKKPCAFLNGIQNIYLPVRHGEGRLVAKKDVLAHISREGLDVLRYTDNGGKPTMEYPANPNGSMNAIAGLCDPTGRIFGLMPHPEAFLIFENHPRWTRIKEERIRRGLPVPDEGQGLQIFRNAVSYAQSSL